MAAVGDHPELRTCDHRPTGGPGRAGPRGRLLGRGPPPGVRDHRPGPLHGRQPVVPAGREPGAAHRAWPAGVPRRRWWAGPQIESTSPARFDPNMGRFLAKIRSTLGL